ncbi:MAG: HEAT repeat domain-containing protein [Fimbriimonadaceae bacterium]|nr:HEAT repeat domain-containing protein [Fimbriimonadaceae bacterium]
MKTALLALSLLAGLAVAQTPDPYTALRTYDWQDRTAILAIQQQIVAAGPDAAKLRAVESGLVGVLTAADSTPGARSAACRLLWMAGGEACVPAVAKLLGDPQLSDPARFALERNPSAAAGAALLAALGSTTGGVRVGVINSLGDRREPTSVGALGKLLANPDVATAQAAVTALGQIGTPAAVAALRGVAAKDLVTGQALVAAADGLAAAGRAADAGAVLRLAVDATYPSVVRAAAVRGLVALRDPQALATVVALLGEPDSFEQRTAARQVAVLADPATIAQITAPLAKASPGTQAVLLTALQERGEAAAAPLALAALGHADAAVRAAALRCAGMVGGAAAVRPLAEVAAQPDKADKAVAREALARAPGAGVAQAIATLAMQGPPPVRLELLSILADRNQQGSLPLFKTAAREADPKIASEAWKSLGRMATPADQAELVTMLLAAQDEAVADAAQTAIIAASRRIDDRNAALAPVLAAVDTAQAEQQVLLLGILAGVGGDQALATLTKATGSTAEDVKKAAVDGLANAWEDAKALPVLLKLAQNETDRVLKVTALRGYLRIVGQDEGARPEVRVERLTAALAAATRVQEKQNALTILRACRIGPAVELAAKYLADAEVGNDAAATVVDLAAPQERNRKKLAAVKGPAVKAALQQVVETVKDGKLQEQARKLLAQG